MKRLKLFLILVISFIALYGCSEDEPTGTKTSDNVETKVVENKKATSIEELNENYFLMKENEEHVSYEKALANFDFPIYQVETLDVLEQASYDETYMVKNEQYDEIIQVMGTFMDSTFTRMGLYIVTGFYDENDKLYQEIQDTYQELTYEETEEYQSTHWVSSDGLYHRFISFGKVMTKDELVENSEFVQTVYEMNIEEAPVLPSYFVVSAIEDVRNETALEVYPYFSYSGGVQEWKFGYLVVPFGITNEKIIEVGEAVYAKTLERFKESPLYNEANWADKNNGFSLQVRYSDQEDWFIKGSKIDIDTLEWTDINGNIITLNEKADENEGSNSSATTSSDNANSTISIDDMHFIADKRVEELNRTFDTEFGKEVALKVNLDHDENPEIFVLEMVTNETSEVSVQEYDAENQQWVKVYSDASFPHFDGIEALQLLGVATYLTDDNRQQIFLGSIGGSGGFLSFFALGSDENGAIKVILDRMDEYYSHGELVIDDLDQMKVLVKSNGEIVETFTAEDFTN